MIPSRSLSIIEIITETIRTTGRVFARYGILFLMLSIPGVCLMTIGISNFTQAAISGARHDINFSDSNLTEFRDDTKSYLAAQNPLLFPDAVKDTSRMKTSGDEILSASSRQFVNYIKANISRFASPLSLAIFGFVLYFVGMFVLSAATVDMACSDFEERPLELWRSLLASLKRDAWKIILLYIIYMTANTLAEAILSVLPAAAGNMLSGFITIAELCLAARLIATVPVIVSEGLGPFKALARSWQLTRRKGWRIFGVSFVFGILLFSISTIVSIIAGFAFPNVTTWLTAFFASGPITVKWMIESLPDFLASSAAYASVIMLVVFALLPAFGTILYYDLRTRLDGPLVYLDERV